MEYFTIRNGGLNEKGYPSKTEKLHYCSQKTTTAIIMFNGHYGKSRKFKIRYE